ncbi:hypothetical protein I4U23_004668 [Adineta vaga]|nr:hypothetical protein I4U23_004668 [Adineta vaga]
MHSNTVSIVTIVIFLTSLVSRIESVCKISSASGYRGTIEQCYCECNRAYQGGFKATTCTWFPAGQFSTGGCTYCDSGRRRRRTSTPSGPFAVQKCSCIGCDLLSGVYTGTLEQCQSLCQSKANTFLNNQVTFSYLPNGQFSKGSCKCCGYKDPCLPF